MCRLDRRSRPRNSLPDARLSFDAGFHLKPAPNLIRYPLNSTYEQVRLLRSTSPTGPFAVVATLTGQHDRPKDGRGRLR